MIFEPAATRKGFLRLLDFTLRTQYDSRRPMGNVAQSDLNEVIEAWLVGLSAEIAPVLPRSLAWLDRAIDEDETFGESKNFHRLTLHWAKALGLWMYRGVNVPEEWEVVRQCHDAALRDGDAFASDDVPTECLDDYMAFCFQAGQYEAGIAEFEKYWGAKALSLKKRLKPRELGYALCLHQARGQFEATDLFAAGRKMLAANLEDDWLGRGQAILAATWLKVVYWHNDPSLSPLQTILCAYDNMPKVPRPEFLGA